MALITLTSPPTEAQHDLFKRWLTGEDHLLLREDARPLIWRANPTLARGCIRKADADALGGRIHSDWTVISDDHWAALVAEQQPHVTW